jgi:predicted dehydrogenase
MSNRRYRIGILGCARIVRRAFAEAVRRSGRGELTAIASREPGRAEIWARDLGIPRHFPSYDALVASPDVDALYLPLPNHLHRPWTLAAAAAGKHVLCEKPLALNAAEAEAMVEGCRRGGVLLMEAFMWRHQPRVHRARALVDGGALGQLRRVVVELSFRPGPRDWRLQAECGGGADFDLGCYGMDIARFFCGAEPIDYEAARATTRRGIVVEASLRARFPSAVVAHIDVSFNRAPSNRVELEGTDATLDFPLGILPDRRAHLVLRSRCGASERIDIEPGDQYAAEVDAFCASIEAGHLIAPAEDGLLNMRALDDARAAAWCVSRPRWAFWR